MKARGSVAPPTSGSLVLLVLRIMVAAIWFACSEKAEHYRGPYSNKLIQMEDWVSTENFHFRIQIYFGMTCGILTVWSQLGLAINSACVNEILL